MHRIRIDILLICYSMFKQFIVNTLYYCVKLWLFNWYICSFDLYEICSFFINISFNNFGGMETSDPITLNCQYMILVRIYVEESANREQFLVYLALCNITTIHCGCKYVFLLKTSCHLIRKRLRLRLILIWIQ